MASACVSSEEFYHSEIRKLALREIFENENGYVELLDTIIKDYMDPLKSSDYSKLLSASLVEEIFGQIPILLSLHQHFLAELKLEMEDTNVKPNIGNIFLQIFFRHTFVVDIYVLYAKNYKRANEIVIREKQSKPAFRRFLEVTARQHSEKIPLNMLLIAPLQIFLKHKLLLRSLVKQTEENDPDHALLLSSQQLVHNLLLMMNSIQAQDIELEQLGKLQTAIDGLTELAILGRQYLRHDSASVCLGAARPKERELFLFSDLLVIVKRRKIRMPRLIVSANLSSRSNNMYYSTDYLGQSVVQNTLKSKMYKLLIRIPLKDAQLITPINDYCNQSVGQYKRLPADGAPADGAATDTPVQPNKQLIEDPRTQSPCLNIIAFMPNGRKNVSILFSDTETRTLWETTVKEAKQRLALSGNINPWLEHFAEIPKRKTKSGFQSKLASFVNLNIGSNKEIGEEFLDQKIHLNSSSSDEGYAGQNNEYIQLFVSLVICVENEETESKSATLLSIVRGIIYLCNFGDNIDTTEHKTKCWVVLYV